jgi:hypothetical protein
VETFYAHRRRKAVFVYLQNILRASRENGFLAAATRIVATLALCLLLPALAHAYTIVMRGGHQVEIPDKFEVTQTTLTYETSHGINVMLQISSIDIAATERANGESPGSLLRRAMQPTGVSSSPAKVAAAPRARKTLTNLDLEKNRRARLESEAAYERRRKELGLPSREETEQRRALEAARAREILGQSDAEKSESEAYWRERATALRNEIQVIDAEINYLRARISETSEIISTVSYASIGYSPFFFTGQRIHTPPVINGVTASSSSVSMQTGTQVGGRVFYGDNSRARISLNFSNSSAYYARRGFYRPCLFAPCFPNFVETYPAYSASPERATLVARLRELEATRAGLQARWRILEDEARRAGAQPGWLRP